MAFNTKQYTWSDVRVVMLGRELTGIQGVSYKTTRDKEPVYGRGSEPLSIQSGNKSYEGTITLLQSELQALEAAVQAVNPLYDLTDVSFDIIVSYGDGANSTTDILQSVEISEYEKGLEQADKYMAVELSFMAIGIKRNA